MCLIEQCDKANHAHGLCTRHYRNWSRYGDPTPSAGHKGARKGCVPGCTCGRHSLRRGKVDSLPCAHCGVVRKVAFCDGPEGNSPEKFCSRTCYRLWSENRRETRQAQTGKKYHYDMSESEFAERLAAQDWKCAICATEVDEKTAHRDHCHKTGEWRALLCGKCNRGLGLFGDDPDILLAAAFYLTQRMDVLQRMGM